MNDNKGEYLHPKTSSNSKGATVWLQQQPHLQNSGDPQDYYEEMNFLRRYNVDDKKRSGPSAFSAKAERKIERVSANKRRDEL